MVVEFLVSENRLTYSSDYVPFPAGYLRDLCIAIKSNDIELVRKILANEVIRSDDKEQISFCMWEALVRDQKEIVNLLIDFGADVNQKFNLVSEGLQIKNIAYLQLMAFWRYDESQSTEIRIAELLIQRNADLNAFVSGSLEVNYTPLQLAIISQKRCYAEFLLKNGARLNNGPEWDHVMPIEFVLNMKTKRKQQEMLQLLIDYGLDTGSRSEDGFDSLRLTINHAIKSNNDVIELVRILLNSGMTGNSLDNYGVSTWVSSMKLKNLEISSLFIERGADVNDKSSIGGIFPLLLATGLDDLQFVDFFLKNGAKINEKADDGTTALHVACDFASKEMINNLIKNGADITAENKDGRTPFSILNPQEYQESKVPCINAMIKEISKRYFFQESNVSQKDVDLMRSHPDICQFSQNCNQELIKMSDETFYSCYSYGYILKNAKNVKKLANLTRNQAFVSGFLENLKDFSFYSNDVQIILDEAIEVKDRMLTVEKKLKAEFYFFPAVVISRLANELTVEDLPDDPAVDI